MDIDRIKALPEVSRESNFGMREIIVLIRKIYFAQIRNDNGVMIA